jgi:hypothetical protein
MAKRFPIKITLLAVFWHSYLQNVLKMQLCAAK